MDNVTLIRIVAGALAVVVLFIIIMASPPEDGRVRNT